MKPKSFIEWYRLHEDRFYEENVSEYMIEKEYETYVDELGDYLYELQKEREYNESAS